MSEQKMKHIQGTTVKQIRDKHRQPSYNFSTATQHILEFRKWLNHVHWKGRGFPATKHLGPGRRPSQFRKGTLDRTHHALGETRRNSNLSGKCKDFHSEFVSLLTDISGNQELITRALLNDIYAQILPQIETSQVTRATKHKREPRPRPIVWGNGRDTDIQEHFRKNLNLLAKTRERP
jgi:hypothetical protein